MPVRSTEHAAGFDLFASHDCLVPARRKALIKTDIAICIPIGTYARVAPRSGLAWKSSIDTGAGVIDYDYRGNVGVILFNHSDDDFRVEKGDRVAQLILEKICMAGAIEVSELPQTVRGEGGFGSTGGSKALENSESRGSPGKPSPSKKVCLESGENLDKNGMLSYVKSLEEIGLAFNPLEIEKLNQFALLEDERLKSAIVSHKKLGDVEELKRSIASLLGI